MGIRSPQRPRGTRVDTTKDCMADVLSQTCRYKLRSARVEKLGQATAVAMEQIADWLKKLGMSEYADRFVENRIDISVLPDLTEQHLKDLGIALGDRLKILRAIRDLGGASVAVTEPSAPVATEPTRRDDAERRQLTVMFTDLVG